MIVKQKTTAHDFQNRTLCLDDNAFMELPDSLGALTSLLELQVSCSKPSSMLYVLLIRRSVADVGCKRSLPASLKWPFCLPYVLEEI